MIIRNDDVAYDTFLNGDLRRFCNLCDKYGFRILQGVTPFGGVLQITDPQTPNTIIKSFCAGKTIVDCEPLLDYLRSRNDLIAVHGLFHTHIPPIEEVEAAKEFIISVGLNPTYYIPPFNEGDYQRTVCGLKLSAADAQNVEHFLKSDSVPTTEIAYTHFWRYGKWYPWEDLDRCLARIATSLTT